MLAFIRKTIFSSFLISLTLFLVGCGGSDTVDQRPANSNPFAPPETSFTPSNQQSPKISRTKRTKTSPKSPSKNISKQRPKPVPVVNGTPDPGKIITLASKRTLDSENPGVAIIVNGISGNENQALEILQEKMRLLLPNTPTGIQQKQKIPADPIQEDLEHFVFDKQLVLIMRPVPSDLFAFAQRLNWGKITNVDLQNRIITVDTQMQKLNSLAAQESSPPSASPTQKSNSNQALKTGNTSKPMVKTPVTKTKAPEIKGNDRDLKPRAGEETIDWALRVIAGTSSFAHDTACKKLASMEPDQNQLERVSSVLANTLPLAKNGFRMKEHVNAMAVWYSDDATMAFATLLADEKSALVREKIIALLPKIHSETTAQVIVGRLSNRADRKHARTAIRIMGSIAEKPVIELLNDPDPSLRIETCKVLQYIGGKEALDALKARAEIENSKVIKDLISQTQSEIQKKLEKSDQ